VQPSCSEQRQLEQLVWSCVQLGSEHLKGWRHCSFSGQCVSVVSGPYRKKALFLCLNEISCICYVQILYSLAKQTAWLQQRQSLTTFPSSPTLPALAHSNDCK